MSSIVAIINYGLSNLSSVLNAFEYIGVNTRIIDNPAELTSASHALLPGVGAFGQAMVNLKAKGWIDVINEHAVHKQKPLLGICLGMQLLADSGDEHGLHDGLGLIPGKVRLMPRTDNIRIPHIGWNSVEIQNNTKTYDDIIMPDDFYFVHSYTYQPNDLNDISGTTHHGQTFASSIERDNIWGVQFHPEKSHKAGLQILKNFGELS